MDIDPGPHPNPTTSHHRKIELQSASDLAYLQGNLSTAARQKLDLHFPLSAYKAGGKQSAQPATFISLDGVKNTEEAVPEPAPASENLDEADADPLRARVRQLVDAYMVRIWESAAKNITVNGMEVDMPSLAVQSEAKAREASAPGEEKEGVDFSYEAFDTRLQSRLAGLYGELETLTAQVSHLRRTAPQQGANAFKETLAMDIDSDDTEFEARMAALRTAAATADTQNPLGLKPLRAGWHDDVRAMYELGTRGLAGLAGLRSNDSNNPDMGFVHQGASLTETVGKVQRARTVAMEFE